MVKHIIVIILLSILIILTPTYSKEILEALLSAHDWVANLLRDVFSSGTSGNATRQLIAALTIPLIVALVPAAVYWLARRSWFPYFIHVVWVVWLLQTAALVIQTKMA